jgi:hypothetical protein
MRIDSQRFESRYPNSGAIEDDLVFIEFSSDPSDSLVNPISRIDRSSPILGKFDRSDFGTTPEDGR